MSCLVHHGCLLPDSYRRTMNPLSDFYPALFKNVEVRALMRIICRNKIQDPH